MKPGQEIDYLKKIWLSAESVGKNTTVLLRLLHTGPSFPRAFGGNPVRQFSKLLYNVSFKRS
ncbi:MAG: hypothetical protein ACI9MF_002357, partial [Gammaproteobacteria bacterium]